jgi:UDP-glucose:tetrahydrobiopterin glucosyltransferase
MRVGLLAPLVAPLGEAQVGGAQALVCDLAAALAGRGHEVEVIAATGSTVPGIAIVDGGVDAAEVVAATYRSDGGNRDSARVDRAHRRALDVARSRDYAVLHTHAFDAAAIRHAGGAAPAVVHTLHLPPDPEIAAAVAEARRAPRPPAVACVSAAQARDWERHCPVDAVLPNGVPVAEIGWDARPGDAAVFAGRLSPEKGADDAVRIALRAGLAVDVYGAPYDPAYAERCRERWSGYPTVRFCGAITRRSLWRRLARAVALLAPSRWDEPFGLSAAEAQAAGTPVVGYRTGGLAEVVADGRSGFLVDPGDLEAAAAALARAGGLSRGGCRRHAEEHLDIADTAAAHERLYAALLGG